MRGLILNQVNQDPTQPKKQNHSYVYWISIVQHTLVSIISFSPHKAPSGWILLFPLHRGEKGSKWYLLAEATQKWVMDGEWVCDRLCLRLPSPTLSILKIHLRGVTKKQLTPKWPGQPSRLYTDVFLPSRTHWKLQFPKSLDRVVPRALWAKKGERNNK